MVLVLVIWLGLPRAWVERWWHGSPRSRPPAANGARFIQILPPPIEILPEPDARERPRERRPVLPPLPTLPPTLGLTSDWWAAAQAGLNQSRLEALLRPASAESTRVIAVLRQGLLDSRELGALPDSSRSAVLLRAEQRLRDRWRELRPLAGQLGHARRAREFANLEKRLFGELAGAE